MSPWYQASGNPFSTLPNLFTEPNPHVHASSRRKIAAAYSMTSLVRLEPLVDECTTILEARLREFASADQTFDLSLWMQCFAFDVIGKITFGERFGFLDSGADIDGIMASLTEYLNHCARVGVFPEWHKTLFRRKMKSRSLSGVPNIRRFASTHLEAKSAKTQLGEDKDGPVDIITRLLSIQSEDPDKIGKDEILSTAVMNIGAGSDTTSIAKLREEIASYEVNGLLSNPVKFAEAQKMPYLQAVIKEALRVHPAAGLILGRVVPEGGALLAGQHFPPGFGQGSRTCIGKNISLMEISKVIPQIVRQFDLVPDTTSGNRSGKRRMCGSSRRKISTVNLVYLRKRE
ncbi:unnamed protein product [Parascedosporium putredinis]|uniref:Uncharacterized protein n=1 Tax=Parascedosporium putredinis TaxID=1442378 RepID=A0A9P1MDJ3_9PEZI|nr:unnamed protein product [Parascedosporium putredinis]CAI8002759.1 unnamed protein product [Parascedosporium putredinis]